jgi:tRNA(adenine34) deaminase
MNPENEQAAQDLSMMKEALREAHKAIQEDEVPVGAIVVWNGKIIGRGHNLTEKLNDVTAHAEMQAITAASHYLGGKYLTECSLYVSLEPCLMCAGAIGWARPARLIIGASDPKKGYSLWGRDMLHPKTLVINGILEQECSTLITEFFRKKRQ